MYDEYGFNPYGNRMIDECEQPAIHEILAATEEQLKDIPLEEQVRLLKEQVADLGESLSRCIKILNEFQYISTNSMHHTDRRLDAVAYELDRHANKYHAMLIVGHKEVEEDESDIS